MENISYPDYYDGEFQLMFYTEPIFVSRNGEWTKWESTDLYDLGTPENAAKFERLSFADKCVTFCKREELDPATPSGKRPAEYHRYRFETHGGYVVIFDTMFRYAGEVDNGERMRYNEGGGDARN